MKNSTAQALNIVALAFVLIAPFFIIPALTISTTYMLGVVGSAFLGFLAYMASDLADFAANLK